jgi:hypothetical protein
MPFQSETNKGGYFFYDLNLKANYEIDDKNRIFLSGYFGRDKFFFSSKYDGTESGGALAWGNATGTLRWNRIISPKLFSNATATYSRYRFVTDIKGEDREEAMGSTYVNRYGISYLSSIEDVGGRWDFEYKYAANTSFKWGASVTQHAFEPGVSSLKFSDGGVSLDTSFGSIRQNALDNVVYGLIDATLSDRLRVNIGVHANNFAVGTKNYLSVQPRFSARYLVSEKGSFKWSYVQMAQFMHLLANQTIGLPTDLWVPATENIRPQESWQTAAGYAHNFGKGWELSVEAYYKDMQNLIEYKEGATFFLGFSDWQTKVTTGRGWAYGAEFLYEKKTGSTTGWVGYTLSWTRMQFPDLNFGKAFYARYDRRHDASVVVMYKLREGLSLSATWVYGTGNAITLPLASYSLPTHSPLPSANSFLNFYNNATEYSDRNAYRMAAYHRMDVGIQWHKKKSWGERTWELSVYNLYNRRNPYFYYIGSTNNLQNQSVTTLKQITLFPLIPSLSYNFKF